MSTLLWVIVSAFASGVLYIALLFSGAFRKKYRGGPHYFLTFGIILRPIRLAEPISETEAQRLEKEGKVYYIGHYDDSGNPLTAEKRRNGKTNFLFTYTYENGKLMKYTFNNYETGFWARKERTPAGSWTDAPDQNEP
jgi:hypothetical protein